VPNPGFLNQSTRKVEVLVTLGNTHWSPTYREALMQALVIEKLTGLAAERDAPVQHLHTPVAPFPQTHGSERGDGSNERLRDAIGPCMRFAIGVDPKMSETRLDFETELAALAEEYGFGLKLDDQRFNRVRGEWFTIRGFDRERYRQARGKLFPEASVLTPRRAVIASVVGPSRTGTTAAVVAALRTRGIGVLAASISSMRKTTFINLVLPVAADTPATLPQWSGGWLDALGRLGACADHRPGVADESDESLIADWKVAVSPAMRCSYPQSSQHTGATTTGRVPYPIWLWWQLPHRTVDTPALLAAVQAGLQPHTRRCEIAYAQSRLCRGDVVRGRAKLIVMLSQEHRDHAAVQRLLTDAAEAAQQRIRERLPALGRVDASKVRLRLSPRERWLTYAGIFA
jgi:predicted amino acid-binding ACT domain protein